MSEEHRCHRCNAPFWHFTGVNTRKFECGSDTQIPSMACRYASQLQDRIKRMEEAGDTMLNAWLMPEDSMEYCDWIALSADAKAKWFKAKEVNS